MEPSLNDLSARNLARYGLRRAAYNGSQRRRFVIFADNGNGTEAAREYNTKHERDTKARQLLRYRAQPFVIGPARYSKGKMAVICTPDGSGFKTREARLAERLANGRYTHRESAYIMSPAAAERFRRMYAEGWDASPIMGTLTAPRPDVEPVD